MVETALRIAIVGAESTGKSRLAEALAARLGEEFGLEAIAVPEVLREWCDAHGRTPRADEQAAIARDQQQRIDQAAAAAEVVLCDTTPLMTAVYSHMVFDDASLDDAARDAHRQIDFTLLTALDLPWIADGLQRDGPHVRAPVDAQVRRFLTAWGGDWSVVSGQGPARTDCALAALRPALTRWIEARAARSARSHGLFTALLQGRVGPARPLPRCTRCDLPDCEHQLARSGSVRN